MLALPCDFVVEFRIGIQLEVCFIVLAGPVVLVHLALWACHQILLSIPRDFVAELCAGCVVTDEVSSHFHQRQLQCFVCVVLAVGRVCAVQ